MSQTTVADFLEISNQQYSQYESGKSKLTVEQMIKIAEYFNVSASFFLGEDNVSRLKYEELQAKYISLLEGKQGGYNAVLGDGSFNAQNIQK